MRSLIALALALALFPTTASAGGIGVADEPRWVGDGLCVDVEIDQGAAVSVTSVAPPDSPFGSCGVQAISWQEGDPGAWEMSPGLVFTGTSPRGRELWSVWFGVADPECRYVLRLHDHAGDELARFSMGHPELEERPCAAAPGGNL